MLPMKYKNPLLTHHVLITNPIIILGIFVLSRVKFAIHTGSTGFNITTPLLLEVLFAYFCLIRFHNFLHNFVMSFT